MKKYIKNGVVKNAEDIVVRGKARFIFQPTEEQILADGWVEYVEPPKPEYKKSPFEIVEELVTKQWNERTDIGNSEALDYQRIVYDWEHYLGQLIPAGRIVGYGGKLWRARQQHTVFEHYPPSKETASLYEVIEREHAGTLDDPKPYTPPMEIFSGVYYTENGVVYRCTRDSGTALTYHLSDLVGLYVEQVNQ